MKKQKIVEPAALKEAVPPRNGVQVGDTVMRYPVTFTPPEYKHYSPMEGKVVYVHPRGRFHVVEFPGRDGAVRESFFGVMK